MAGLNREAIMAEYGKLPLSFEPTQDGDSQEFVARTAGGTVKLMGKQIVITLNKPTPPALGSGHSSAEPPSTLRIGLEGPNPDVRARATGELPGKSNFFYGDKPRNWKTDVPNFSRVEYSNIYLGIDLVYYGDRSGHLEHDFVVKPGANPATIQLNIEGAESVQLLDTGSLQIGLSHGTRAETATLLRPVIYQEIEGRRVKVAGEYRRLGPDAVGFQIGDYDHSRDLVIDPVLDYSTYLGGGILTGATAIAVDSGGNAYIVGHSGVGGSFPTTKGSFDPSCNDCSAAFVAKLNPTGTALVYSTYLSGGLFDQANAVAVDSTGAAYVAGITESSGFPVTKGAVQTKFGGAFSNGFITKLNPAGSKLDYSTYLGGDGPASCYTEAGGSQADHATGIAIDSAGDAYVTGCTSSKNFPTTKGAFENKCEGCEAGYASAFAAKLNPTGTELLYSTFLGGNGLDFGYGIAVDSSDHAYITGSTTSTNLTVLSNAYQKHLNAAGGQNAFVTKLSDAGTGIVYSTYLGGSVVDGAYAIAVNSAGHAYVTGYASSPDFPIVKGAYQKTCKDCANYETGFVSVFNDAGSELLSSTFLGGNGFDALNGIAVNASGHIFVSGLTESTDFPTTSTAYKTSCSQCSVNSGASSATFTVLNSSGSALVYSTYLGGSGSDSGAAVALDTAGNAYVVGAAGSTNFPISASAVQPTCSACAGGDTGAFVTKFYFGSGLPSVSLSPASLSFGDQALKQASSAHAVELTNKGAGPLQVDSFKVAGADPGDFGGTESCRTVVPPGATCSIDVKFTPQALGARSGVIEITDNAPGSPQKIDLSGTGVKPAPKATFSPTSVNFGDVALDTVADATLTLKNTGSATLAVTAASITGTGEANFGGDTNCGSDITPGGSCTFTLGFEPTAKTTYKATLKVTTSASTTPVEIPLTGTGIADAAAVSQ